MERFSSIESLITLAIALAVVVLGAVWVGRQQTRYARLAAWTVSCPGPTIQYVTKKPLFISSEKFKI